MKVYRSIGAIPMDEWTVQRLDEQALKQCLGYRIEFDLVIVLVQKTEQP